MAEGRGSLSPTRDIVRVSDLRGLARLGVDGVVGVTDLVETVHRTITSGIVGRPRAGRTRGLTGVIYGTVRGTTRAIGSGLDAVLGAVAPPPGSSAPSASREAFVAALNGVWGDHLAATDNPLAIPMSFRVGGRALDLDAPSLAVPSCPRVLLLVHGLCMSDLQWQRRGHDHGQALAREAGYAAVYLHYNSGRHVSENGREFAALLERLLLRWPVPVEDLAILGHSMGGLVTRSACHYAARARHHWPSRLTKLAFLGTPHHGAALERGGHLVDQLFDVSPYAAPFARLGKARSAGITDLRYGNVTDEDWSGRDRYSQRTDDRCPTPLPEGVEACIIAASTKSQRGRVHGALVGDGIVPLSSALGLHRDRELSLRTPRARRLVVSPANHWDLLNHPAVHARLLQLLRRRRLED